MHENFIQDEKGRWYFTLNENLKRNAALYPEGPIASVVSIDIDMTDAISLRQKNQKENNIHLSVTSLIIKAAANILPRFRVLCGIWEYMDKIRCPDREEINIFGPVQVGEKIGFFSIKRANQKTLFQIAKELNPQVKALQSTREADIVWPEELKSIPQPGFCITNIGTLGNVETVHVPVCTLMTSRLAICSILEKPVVKKKQIVIRQIMNVFLDWDHRAMMACVPVGFLNQFKQNLENPFDCLM
jgi:pyruvate dehydrogenase E2 component (dihydrolipoamide acetyltransferase)